MFLQTCLQYIKSKRVVWLGLLISIFAVLNLYLFKNYRVAPLSIQKISFETNLNANDILIYITKKNAFGTDFSEPYHPLAKHDTLVFDMKDIQVRSFRLYVGIKKDSLFIKNIKIENDNIELLSLSNFTFNGISNRKLVNDFGMFFASEQNGYLELKKSHISFNEVLVSEVLVFLLSFLLSVLSLFAIRDFSIDFSQIKALSVLFFLGAIFLPHPIFNIAFILSLALVIRDFNFKQLLASNASVCFILYFLLFILINFFTTTTFNKKITETLIPIFLLPIYFASIPKYNYLKVFPISAFFLSIYFFGSSLLDGVIYSNINYFSFDAFTKYLHPVYFSYLLLFSLVYLELEDSNLYNKAIFRMVLLTSLLFCGSKLIISLTILFFSYRFFRKKVVLGFSVLAILIVSILLFSPTKKRFIEVVNLSNLSILSERPLKSVHDERLNGLTLRLIIWQESLSSISNSMELFFGKGVGDEADLFLENKLLKRGLEPGQAKYDPHNQFIATLFKFGIIADFLILVICISLFYKGTRDRNHLLVYFVVIFFIVMFTESILQRVVGINFFISILLLLSTRITYPSKYLENSNHRD